MSANGAPAERGRRIIKKIIEAEEEEEGDEGGGEEIGPLKDIFTLRPTTLARKMFGPEVVDKWRHSGTGTTSAGKQRLLKVRDIWELSTTTAQCNNIIGPNDGKKSCWICGIGIPLRTTKRQLGYAGQCEHILPIAQGVMIWSLYGPKDKGDAEFKEYLKLEYDWAHTVCNQVKSAMVLLTPSADGKTCSVNVRKVIVLLENIYTSTRADSSSLKSELQGLHRGVDKFVAARGLAVEKRLEPMVAMINQNLTAWGPKMVTLAAVAKAKGRAVESITTLDDIANAINSEEPPIIIPISEAESQAAPADEEFTESLTEYERAAAEVMIAMRGDPEVEADLTPSKGKGRKTHRRKERLFHKLGRKTKHRKRYHAMRMSSRRHSLSGKAARR
jgi:hypothetical protein